MSKQEKCVFKNGSHRNWGYQQTLEKVYSLLKSANESYYNSSKTIISDDVYDDLVDIYNSRSPEKFSLIGANVESKDKVKLPVHMGSMNKTYSIKEFHKWLEKNTAKEYVVTPKIDGSSCSIKFSVNFNNEVMTNENLNIEIFSRGDGNHGKHLNHLDEFILNKKIKANIKSFMNITKISSFIVRGELIISKENFANNLVGSFKSSRSLVNGLSNKKESTTSDNIKYLEFVLFEVVEPNLPPKNQFIIADQLGFTYTKPDVLSLDNIILKNKEIESSYLLSKLELLKSHYAYDIDGLIITSNLSYTIPQDGNPSYSIAFKSNGAGKITTIRNIEWNVSKHGLLIPKLVFDEIILGNSCVTKCTGFNGWFVFSNSLGIGAKIRVVLSGEVIPYITQIIEPADIPLMPQKKYVWNKTKIHCILKEESNDFEIKRIMNFIKVIGIENIGIGLVKLLYDSGFDSVGKMLNIRYDELIKIDRIEDKMANKIINSINKVTNDKIDLSLVMDGSLCFGNGFGLKRCKQVSEKFPNFIETLPNDDELLELSGWSAKSIEKFKNGIPYFKQFITSIDINISNDRKKTYSKISISKICITGKRDKEIIDFAITNGVTISGSLTSDVDLLICENKNSKSGKLTAAQSKNIPILTIEEFKKKIKLI